jgi:hypothetical protein
VVFHAISSFQIHLYDSARTELFDTIMTGASLLLTNNDHGLHLGCIIVYRARDNFRSPKCLDLSSNKNLNLKLHEVYN